MLFNHRRAILGGDCMSKLLATSKIAGQCTVTLREYPHGAMGSTFIVRYGKQVTHWANEVLAQEDYLSCVIHQSTCAGWNG
ncbi:hypothetical protein HOR33_gp02 [Klebsiella phage vB_KpnP_IL33]|uniref:Uncharacterized protein n=5 Tax=Przondovirus TaxID=1985720 RepID=A0A2H4ZCR8_9CAUD|nr:hypothetical protein HOR32_gp02 [Klebsiella phage vB_KpnP_BIS33]YP_009787504.1 hypothetical protein HOR33_gp02 [Klebsiella phage vB_KpnP_IL33]AUF73713.1 hypothetical protein IL33_02 [Klebsiella phage vB_KpnP_IL33]AUF73722.1 hypothetical protein BIS33_02 [Klebsiella phage vB_KpnP_BIS33]